MSYEQNNALHNYESYILPIKWQKYTENVQGQPGSKI